MAAIAVFCASSTTLDPRWFDLAAEVGRELGNRGHSLVWGGGRIGMMGRVAAGAREAGARTVGVMPQTLIDREIADLEADELVVTDDMAERKTIMLERSDAVLVLPGGLGTFDELFEVWTTAMLSLHRKPIALLNADGFYTGLLEWLDELEPAAFARPGVLDLVHRADSVKAAFDALDRDLVREADGTG